MNSYGVYGVNRYSSVLYLKAPSAMSQMPWTKRYPADFPGQNLGWFAAHQHLVAKDPIRNDLTRQCGSIVVLTCVAFFNKEGRDTHLKH